MNSSPIDVITQHPYLFAFKNANYIARHAPDAQNLRFSANPRAYLGHHVRGGPGTGYSLAAIGARPAKGLIGAELWLNQPWFTYHHETTEIIKSIGAPPHQPVLMYPSGSLKGVLSDTIVDLLQQAVDAANTGYAFAQYSLGDGPRSATLEQAVAAPNLLYNQHHFVQWEFLSPYLPIIRVTTYAEQRLPFTIETEYDIPTNYGIQRFHKDSTTFIATEPAKSTGVTQPTRYAASFVVALQNRWEHFSDPNRLAYFNEDQRPETLTDPQINRWYPTDFMHHSIIGPVVVQVFESEHLKPGIYQKTPAISHWPAPGYISGSGPYAHNAGITPFNPGTAKGPTLMDYIRSMESEHGGGTLAYGPQYPSRTIGSYAFGSDPFPGEGVVRLSFQHNVQFNRGFETCSRQQWPTGEAYCLYLERLSVAYFIKNEETLLTGYDLP